MLSETIDADTFPKLLLLHSKTRGDRTAILEKSRGIWRATTWRELADEAGALACGLADAGFRRGAHLAVIGDNRPRLYTAMAAAHWLGGVATPLFPDARADEIAALIQMAEATHAYAEDQEQADKLLSILPQCPTLRWIIYDKDRGMRHYKQPQITSYAALLQKGRSLAAEKADWLRSEAERTGASDAACLFFTASAKGPAKGVVLTHGALIDRARAAASVDGLTEADVGLAYLPPAWIGQHMFSYAQPMTTGCCICCPESSETMLEDLREIGPTYFLAPPRVLEAVLARVSSRIGGADGWKRALYKGCIAVAERMGLRELKGQRLYLRDRLLYPIGNLLIYSPLRDQLGMNRLRIAYTTGGTASPQLLSFFRGIGINLKQLYGAAETGFFVAMQRDADVKADSVGLPAERVDISFTPQQEILARSPGLFKEYHRDPQSTREALNGEGWFHTGDAGFLGEDGQLRVIDRVADIGALSDGTLFAPKFLESKIKASPYVKEAAVFGDKHDFVCALIAIDIEATGNWAEKKGISFTGYAELAARPEIYDLIAGSITTVNAKLAGDPAFTKLQIRRFLILPEPLEADDGSLTRMGELRRDVAAERYRNLIGAMFAGRPTAHVDLEMQYEDGREAIVPSNLRVQDVPASLPAKTKKAA